MISKTLKSEVESQHEILLQKKSNGEISLQEYVGKRDRLYKVLDWPTNNTKARNGKIPDQDYNQELMTELRSGTDHICQLLMREDD